MEMAEKATISNHHFFLFQTNSTIRNIATVSTARDDTKSSSLICYQMVQAQAPSQKILVQQQVIYAS
jgi:hypothetical protein